MATITSSGSGLWSATGTWAGGVVPVDNDAVVIAGGHTVEFDVDQSGFADGISGITVTGTLKLTRTTGTYYMKIKAATTIAGAGTLDFGTEASPIPFATKHTIAGGAGWYILGSGGLTMSVYDAEPVHAYVKLSGAESTGATRLEIDTNISGEIWAVGDEIRIDNINKNVQSESRIISAITSTYIDISAGLTSSKLAGSWVHLITRNLKFIGVGGSYICQNFLTGKLTIAGGSFKSLGGRILSTCAGVTISGGVISGNANGLYACIGVTISGGVISGNTNGLSTCAGVTIFGGVISENTYGLSACDAKINVGVAFSSNVYDIYRSKFTGLNITLTSAVENYQYNQLTKEVYSESINHNNINGAFRAWTAGGITTSVDSPALAGFDKVNQIALESSVLPGYWQRRVLVPVGKSIAVTMYLHKSISMSYLPRVWVFEDGNEPLLDADTILHIFTMTNSTNVWESETYVYVNSGTYDKFLNTRFIGMNATGYIYSALAVSTGAVSISPAGGIL